jgi:phosphatidylglycerol---prolipoprotein diacylglyceryl transferase
MNPIAFSVFGLAIRWYGILIATGILLALLVARFNCSLRGFDYDTMLDTALICLPFGIIGARLYYVIFEFSSYNGNILEMLNIRHGGLAIHGGIIFAVTAGYFFSRHRKISFLALADAAAPSIIIAQALGRWGNFFNQEAHGGPVSYEFIKHFPMFIQNGMNIGGTYYHPTFLYESTWNILVFLILMYILRKSRKPGIVFFSYLGLYSLGRFFIEGLRTDSLMLGPIRVAQLVSLAGIIICVAFLIYSRKKASRV